MNPFLDFIFQDIQLTAAIVFFLLLGIFLWFKRDKLEVQKPLFPVLYFFLYRTKLGLKAMDDYAKKFPTFLKWLSYAGVVVGFIGMIFTMGMLVHNVYNILFKEVRVGAAIVQPFVQTDPGSMFFYVPFFYFIISIFIIAVIHEFSHGVVMRLFKAKVKSSGFAFLAVIIPIIPAAFVEQDDKQLNKLKPMQQLAIFAAGPFSNILLALVIILLMNFAIAPLMEGAIHQNVVILNYTNSDEGGMFPAEAAGVKLGDALVKIDDREISTVKEFTQFMKNTRPDQVIILQTNTSQYTVTLGGSPDGKTGYLGIYVTEDTRFTDEFKASYGAFVPAIQWFNGLLLWLVMLNVAIGLINLIPLGPVDGGRMLLVVLRKKFKEEVAMKWFKYISAITLIVLLANVFLPSLLKWIL